VLAEWSRVLRADGLVMFSAYGVDSFKELRKLGWSTQRFPDMHDLGDALIRTGFSAPVMDMEPLTLTWRDPNRAWADLRALGGHALEARSPGLSGRIRKQQWLEALIQGAEDAQDPGTFSVTIELIYGHAWCSPASKLEPGTARVEFVGRRR
jgi:malonyl-CoA O-methyltransferase